MTHISVLVGARSHPGVHVADVAGGPNDQGGASVNDGLATTVARHWVTVDGDTVDSTTDVFERFLHFNRDTFLLFKVWGSVVLISGRYLSILICQ